MQITFQSGYPDYVGRRFIYHGFGTGPASYLRSTGDVIQSIGFNRYIDSVFCSQSVSGTYYALVRPSAAGARQAWSIHWYVTATNAEVADAVNLSAEKLEISGFGGDY